MSVSAACVPAALRRALVLVVLAVSCGVAAIVAATPASAHAFLTTSNPSDGEVVASAPTDLRLEFSERVLLSATRVDLVDSRGRHFAPTGLRMIESDESDGEQPVELVAALPALPHNTYRITWETISADDLHRTSGLIVFGIATPVHAAGVSEPMPKPDEALIRWAMFGLLAVVMGGGVVAALLRRQRTDVAATAARRTLRIAAGSGALAAVAAVALLFDQLAGGGLGLRQVLLSSYGGRWAVRETGLALLAVTALAAVRRPRRSTSWLAGFGVVLAGVGSALLGHSGAAKPLSVARVAADALHLTAAGTWTGMLVLAVVIVVPLLRAGAEAAAAARFVLRRYAIPAAACLTVMAVTGLYLASDVVGSVDAAILTLYGRALLLKLVLVGIATSLGLVNALRIRRGLASASALRTITAESLVALLVVAMAAILTSGQPAREPRFIRTPTSSAVPVVDGGVADLQEAVAVRPNQPGRNVVLVDVFDTRRPSPGPVRTVAVTVIGADGVRSDPVHAKLLADGRWSAPIDLNASGPVKLDVEVGRAGLPALDKVFSWTVAGKSEMSRQPVISMAPLRSPLRTAAIVLGFLCLVAWGIVSLVRLRSRRRLTATPPAGEAVTEPEVAKVDVGVGAGGQ